MIELILIAGVWMNPMNITYMKKYNAHVGPFSEREVGCRISFGYYHHLNVKTKSGTCKEILEKLTK